MNQSVVMRWLRSHFYIKTMSTNEVPLSPKTKDPIRYVKKHHPPNQIVGNLNRGIQTIRMPLNPLTKVHVILISIMEPKDVVEANQVDDWIKEMHGDLDRFEKY